ncbi:MAG TPA: hypothetical protein VN721_15645, partial [Flavipsychrobacter sp.]|nr:hypothetical protein [Flavipsychrobacter sp.]
MKKLYPIIVACYALLSLNSQKVYASHAAGAELVYQWVSDSTYLFSYHFYRDCLGIPEPDSVSMCWFNSCDPTAGGSIWLTKLAILPGGDPNGTQVLLSCPGKPTSCDLATSTLPGYQEWWYSGSLTLPSRCNYWTFNVSIPARNNAISNLNLTTPTPTGTHDLYTQATFDNLDAQGNSSPYFTVKPVPYICDNVPYTYNNGAYDPNNDSIYYEFITPERGNSVSCPLSYADETYVSGYSLFKPLPITGTFVFDDITGQMSFTPNLISIDVVTIKVHELRHIPSLGPDRIEIGSVMRDIEIQIIACSEPQPTVTADTSTVIGATFGGGRLNACATQPFSFDFTATSTDSSAVLVASDNSSIIMPTKERVTYKGTLSDSITGHFTWTPGLTDTGLKV